MRFSGKLSSLRPAVGYKTHEKRNEARVKHAEETTRRGPRPAGFAVLH